MQPPVIRTHSIPQRSWPGEPALSRRHPRDGNARLYPFWNDLTEALRTGKPQNEVKRGGHGVFETLYKGPERLRQFMRAMAGIRPEILRR